VEIAVRKFGDWGRHMAEVRSTTMPEMPEQARCARCGYCLRGITIPRCPECGTPFDAEALLRSLAPKRPRPFTAEDLKQLSAPKWQEYLAVVLAVGWSSVVCDSFYVFEDAPLFVALAPAFGVLLLMLIDFVRAWSILLYCDVPPVLRRLNVGSRLRLAGILILLCSSYWTPWPVYPQFWVSKPALDALAQQVLLTGKTPPDEWVGLYHARYISKIGNGINFRFGNWNDCRGLEYIIRGKQPERAVTYTHLGGGWYYWHL
jgi:hypothetical protein